MKLFLFTILSYRHMLIQMKVEGGIRLEAVAKEYLHSALFEHRFWLRILADHSLFIHNALAPQEVTEIDRAIAFNQTFSRLHASAERNLGAQEVAELTHDAHIYTVELREFKLHLLTRHLLGEISINLPPTFFNHMLNELEEYLRVLDYLLVGEAVPAFHPVHHHLLWLSDAIGHAATLKCEVDPIESKFVKQSEKFAKQFKEFYIKAVELAGFLRTNVEQFPALSFFNREVNLEIKLFQSFLRELEEMRLSKQILGTLFPLMADHMAREECYYLLKLAQSGDIERPNCSPITTDPLLP